MTSPRVGQVPARSKLRARILAGLAGAVIALPSHPAMAQTVAAPQADTAALRARLSTQMAPPGRPVPADAADLDAMYAKRDFGTLTTRLRTTNAGSEVNLDLNWEQTHVFNGAGLIIGYTYMYDLWRLGSALPVPGGDHLKGSAAMMFLYNLSLIALDGTKCTDASAPAHRRDQLVAQNPEIVSYLQHLPKATRMTLGTVAVNVESVTASLRTNDSVLCSGGLAEMTAGLAAQGSKPLQEAPPTSGSIGRTLLVPRAPGYRPQFVSEDVWRPKLAAARASLPASLTRLLTPDAPAPPAQAGQSGH